MQPGKADGKSADGRPRTISISDCLAAAHNDDASREERQERAPFLCPVPSLVCSSLRSKGNELVGAPNNSDERTAAPARAGTFQIGDRGFDLFQPFSTRSTAAEVLGRPFVCTIEDRRTMFLAVPGNSATLLRVLELNI